MTFITRQHIQLTLWFILYWVAAAYFYLLIRYLGHSEVLVNPVDRAKVVDLNVFFLLATLGGILVGIVFGILEKRFEHRKFQRMSYGRLILMKSGIYFLLFFISFALITMLDYTVTTGKFELKQWAATFFSAMILIPLAYMAVMTVLVNFIRQTSIKFGPGNLWKMLSGRFHQPREENRIFMCMDLRDSTTIAEKLGHMRYSQLIQDCFRDLPVVLDYKAEVYQYVGDEVILSWPVEAGIENDNCIQAFFSFVQRLQDRRQYYVSRYGLAPEFKAGINLGKVTVAEIGTIKREISYHGDTLNTASRIQSMCNELNRRLLVSHLLAMKLSDTNHFTIEPMGEMTLKGKAGTLPVFSIEESA